jgi:hypothetical protein
MQLKESESTERPPQEQLLVGLREYDKVNLDLVGAHHVRSQVTA